MLRPRKTRRRRLKRSSSAATTQHTARVSAINLKETEWMAIDGIDVRDSVRQKIYQRRRRRRRSLRKNSGKVVLFFSSNGDDGWVLSQDGTRDTKNATPLFTTPTAAAAEPSQNDDPHYSPSHKTNSTDEKKIAEQLCVHRRLI